ncbi:hypothetical protein AB0I53_15075 [Saccharopolyspora sp. NPDC050389]|uniref:hypothetical protein n=1 Tax=Saccharopolyspora sp. NPDC050389 TaxID=3155516 RepID=UPI0033F6BC4B
MPDRTNLSPRRRLLPRERLNRMQAGGYQIRQPSTVPIGDWQVPNQGEESGDAVRARYTRPE